LARLLEQRSSSRRLSDRGSSYPGTSARWKGRRRRWTPWPNWTLEKKMRGEETQQHERDFGEGC